MTSGEFKSLKFKKLRLSRATTTTKTDFIVRQLTRLT